jgi:hypothetical protein
VVANSEWCEYFKEVKVAVLARRSSDHNPLFVSFARSNISGGRRVQQFRVEENWKLLLEYRIVVKEIWRRRHVLGDPLTKVRRKLQSCQRPIKKWVVK